jgi:hypothetical protein
VADSGEMGEMKLSQLSKQRQRQAQTLVNHCPKKFAASRSIATRRLNVSLVLRFLF